MGNNTQSRKWALVINNPLEAGLDHNAIIEILHRFSPTYFCIADEIAAAGTYHTHVFLYRCQDIRRRQLETWRAFLRRIHVVREYMRDGSVQEAVYGTKRHAQ